VSSSADNHFAAAAGEQQLRLLLPIFTLKEAEMDWVEVVKNLGFPVALSCYLVYNEMKTKAGMARRIEVLENKSDERAGELLEVVKQNTIAMTANASAMNALNNTLKERPCLHGSD
jgi:hypothetical protein